MTPLAVEQSCRINSGRKEDQANASGLVLKEYE